MAYKYTYEEWIEIKRRDRIAQRAFDIAYALDMDDYCQLREEQDRSGGDAAGRGQRNGAEHRPGHALAGQAGRS